jgi:flagellar biogenesis protein FliO
MARQISWRGVLSPDGPGDGRPERATWRPGSPLVPPRSIVDAVRLMQVAAGVEVLEVVRGVLTRSQLRQAFVNEARSGGLNATSADIDGLVRFSLSLTTVVALVSCVVWLALARATARGSRWARIIATVLFPLAIGVFAGGLLPTAGYLGRTLALALLLLGGWALVRLWHRDSSAYIRHQSLPQD